MSPGILVLRDVRSRRSVHCGGSLQISELHEQQRVLLEPWGYACGLEQETCHSMETIKHGGNRLAGFSDPK